MTAPKVELPPVSQRWSALTNALDANRSSTDNRAILEVLGNDKNAMSYLRKVGGDGLLGEFIYGYNNDRSSMESGLGFLFNFLSRNPTRPELKELTLYEGDPIPRAQAGFRWVEGSARQSSGEGLDSLVFPKPRHFILESSNEPYILHFVSPEPDEILESAD